MNVDLFGRTTIDKDIEVPTKDTDTNPPKYRFGLISNKRSV